jgi:uncharacterized protein (TIGR03084 family)
MSELLAGLLEDLDAESDVVTSMLETLSTEQWRLMTPALGWDVGDQVTHLAFFDECATLAAVDEDSFRKQARELESHGPNFSAWVAEQHRSMSLEARYNWLIKARTGLLATFSSIDAKRRLPWYGPPMSPASSLTARIMETWAHGQDVAEAVGITYPQSSRLVHVAFLGIRTLGFSYRVRGLEPPDTSVFVCLEAPDGTVWTWGDSDAPDSVTGSAVDFCRVVTQRCRAEETELVASGKVATQWLGIAQAFAGPPTLAKA